MKEYSKPEITNLPSSGDVLRLSCLLAHTLTESTADFKWCYTNIRLYTLQYISETFMKI